MKTRGRKPQNAEAEPAAEKENVPAAARKKKTSGEKTNPVENTKPAEKIKPAKGGRGRKAASVTTIQPDSEHSDDLEAGGGDASASKKATKKALQTKGRKNSRKQGKEEEIESPKEVVKAAKDKAGAKSAKAKGGAKARGRKASTATKISADQSDEETPDKELPAKTAVSDDEVAPKARKSKVKFVEADTMDGVTQEDDTPKTMTKRGRKNKTDTADSVKATKTTRGRKRGEGATQKSVSIDTGTEKCEDEPSTSKKAKMSPKERPDPIPEADTCKSESPKNKSDDSIDDEVPSGSAMESESADPEQSKLGIQNAKPRRGTFVMSKSQLNSMDGDDEFGLESGGEPSTPVFDPRRGTFVVDKEKVRLMNSTFNGTEESPGMEEDVPTPEIDPQLKTMDSLDARRGTFVVGKTQIMDHSTEEETEIDEEWTPPDQDSSKVTNQSLLRRGTFVLDAKPHTSSGAKFATDSLSDQHVLQPVDENLPEVILQGPEVSSSESSPVDNDTKGKTDASNAQADLSDECFEEDTKSPVMECLNETVNIPASTSEFDVDKESSFADFPMDDEDVGGPGLAQKALLLKQVNTKGDKYIGAHVSIMGGLWNAVHEAVSLGARAFAMFLKPQRQWKCKPLGKEDAMTFRQTLKVYGFSPSMVVPHGSYLMNCGSPKEDILAKSRAMLVDELQRCDALGLDIFNFHPGSTCGQIPREECISLIAESINLALDQSTSVTAVIENMSCQGNTIGGTFDELRAIINEVNDQSRIGICLDTCHAFAAGYDLRTEEGYESMMTELEDIVGMEYLKAVHLNDSKGDLGSKLDRHENIGKGHLGMAAFERVMNDPRLDNIPMVLETPENDYLLEIKALNTLIK